MKIYKITVQKRVQRHGFCEWIGDYVYWGIAETLDEAILKCRRKANKEFHDQIRIIRAEMISEREF